MSAARFLIAAVTITLALPVAAVSMARPRVQAGVITFTELTRVADAFIPRGTYLFVHDDEQMKLGGPCTSIYRTGYPQRAMRLVSFHCCPRMNAAAAHHRLVIERDPGISFSVLREYQFAHDGEAHATPF
jgi:hypothetical protein